MTDRILVPVSGGKDSQAVLALAVDKYGPEVITGVHNYTGIDHSLTYEHMRYMAGRYGVPIVFTKAKYTDIFDMIEKRDMIPGRVARLCTDEFKIQAMNRWLKRQRNHDKILILMGMRAQESIPRMESYGDMSPDDVFSLRDLFPKKTPKYLASIRVQLPIVHRSTPWVYQFLRERGDKINPLYARGHKRVGCYPCLLAGNVDFRLAARDPEGRQTIIKLDTLRAEMFKRKGIEQGGALWNAVLEGRDLQKLLRDEALGNQTQDPFGLRVEDEPDDGGTGCETCDR